MKRSLIVISLCLNLVLLGVFVFLQKQRPLSTAENQKKPVPETLNRKSRGIVSTEYFAPNQPGKLLWHSIESEDYPTYIANLRAVRCPEKTIFDIIFADIEKLFSDQEKQLENENRFWISGEESEQKQLANDEEKWRLQNDKRALITMLLQSELDWEVMQDWYEEDELGAVVGFLTDSQAERALSVAKKFADQIEQVDVRAQGLLIPEDAEEKKKIYLEMTAALRGIISSEELEEAERRLLGVMFSYDSSKELNLTGTELRHITQLKLQWDSPFEREFKRYEGEDSVPELMSNQNFLKQVQTFLGDTRYQNFLRSFENDFDQLFELTAENGLPPQTALGVYEIRQMAVLETARVRENRTLRRKEQRLELEAFEQATRDAVEQLLGETITASYTTNGGSWLKKGKTP